MSNIDILVGDARHLPFPDEYFHTVVTSPPYWGLRDYGLGSDALGMETTPELYVQHLVDIFHEVRRTLRDDGTLWLNLGDSYAANRSYQVPSTKGGPKHSPAQAGQSSNRVPPGLKSKDLVGIPWMVAFALRADGWYLRSDIIWHKPNVMPESVRDRPTKAHEHLFLLSKSKRYYYDQDAIREPFAESTLRGKPTRERKSGSAFVDATPGRDKQSGGKIVMPNPKGRNARSVWVISPKPFPGAHFAVFPEKLVEPCILAGSSEGGNVLDPFAGSGTVGVVAQKLKRNAVLIDAKQEYCEMAMKRCGLFDKVQED